MNLECVICKNTDCKLFKLQCGQCNKCITCKECHDILIGSNIEYKCPLCQKKIIAKYQTIDIVEMTIKLANMLIILSLLGFFYYKVIRFILDGNKYFICLLLLSNFLEIKDIIKTLTEQNQIINQFGIFNQTGKLSFNGCMLKFKNLYDKFYMVNTIYALHYYQPTNIIMKIIAIPFTGLVICYAINLILKLYFDFNLTGHIFWMIPIRYTNIYWKCHEICSEIFGFGKYSVSKILMEILRLNTFPSNWKIYFHYRWINNFVRTLITTIYNNIFRLLYFIYCFYINIMINKLGMKLINNFFQMKALNSIMTFHMISSNFNKSLDKLEIRNNSSLFIFQSITILEFIILILVIYFTSIYKKNTTKFVTCQDLKYPQIGSITEIT